MRTRDPKNRRTREELTELVQWLESSLPGSVICGSWRRGAQVIGDLDVAVPAPLVVPDFLATWRRGSRLAHCHVEGTNVDLYCFEPRQRGAMLWYLTGPRRLSMLMRYAAKDRGWKLNQYGLWDDDDNQLDDGTEESIAQLLSTAALSWPLDPRDRQRYAPQEDPMPAQTVPMEDCASNFGVFEVTGSKGDIYVVSLHGETAPPHCQRRDGGPCPAFKYSREDPPTCKHIKQVLKGACLYNPQYTAGRASPGLRPIEFTYDADAGNACPACGGPLVVVRRAV